MPYRLIDHTADIAFVVEASDWPGLLREATVALGEIIRTLEHRGEAVERRVEVRGEDREDVLVAWLTESVLAFEDDGFLAWGARVDDSDELSACGAFLGRRLDPETEPPDRVVKAVTYHDLSVGVGNDARLWTATVVLDL